MEAIKSILFPTDFSLISENALKYAIQLTGPLGAVLKIFHAYRVPMAVEQGAGAMLLPEQMDHEVLVARQQLEQLVEHYPELKGLRYEIDTKAGPLTSAVKEITDDDGSDLIVMGTHGAEGIKELLMGTNTADVVNDVNVPIMIIPEDVQYNGINNIAFAYDYKGIDDPGKLDMLELLTKKFSAKLHILNVSESREPAKDDDLASLDIFEQRFEEVKHDYTFHLGDDIEKGISDYVENNRISLLAAMPRKHNFFEKLFKKSITNKLTFHTNIPLLLLKN